MIASGAEDQDGGSAFRSTLEILEESRLAGLDVSLPVLIKNATDRGVQVSATPAGAHAFRSGATIKGERS